MPKELENPEDKYKGLFVAIDKDHPYFSIGNVSFTIQKGQVLPHPPFDVGEGVLKVFNSEKEALAYIEKYKDVLVEPRRGTPVTGSKKGKTTRPQTFKKEGVPGRPDKQDVIDQAKQIGVDGTASTPEDLLSDYDIENILDQNANTVKSKINKSNFGKDELKRIKRIENSTKRRISVVDFLTELIGRAK